LLWDQAVADYKEKWILSCGPIVVNGKVLQGVSGSFSRQPGGAAIVALDTATGKQVWRFNTIAHEGESGGDSWNDLPLEKRSGASVWIAGSFDPELNLVFFGTGNTYDTAPFRHKVRPEANVDLLYTNTTLALNPDTGQLVWYFQHMANDLLDHDWAFERTIVILGRGSAKRKLVITGGKTAIFDALEPASGKYVFSYDFGLQNVVSSIDPLTGAKTPNAQTVADDKPHIICPSALGARTWYATSFDPRTKVLYIPLDKLCTEVVPQSGDIHAPVSHMAPPRDDDGKFGVLAALDVENRKQLWTERTRPAQTAAVLATAGGVLFNANLDRYFRANDMQTGVELWRARLNDTANAFPISFAVKGKQYVAIAAGGIKPSLGPKAMFTPEVRVPPSSDPTLWVFTLPERASHAGSH
jgi:alcohol dehydrogenase (cytochrome c)